MDRKKIPSKVLLAGSTAVGLGLAAQNSAGYVRLDLKELMDRLKPIVDGGDDACLNGTPMIPLHKDTVAAIYSRLERLEKLEEVVVYQEDRISQILGQVLGFPWYKDDQKNFPGTTEKDGVCTGDLIAEDLANMAADRLAGKMTAKDLTAIIRAWLDNDDASHWGDFEKALNMILEADL